MDEAGQNTPKSVVGDVPFRSQEERNPADRLKNLLRIHEQAEGTSD